MSLFGWLLGGGGSKKRRRRRSTRTTRPSREPFRGASGTTTPAAERRLLARQLSLEARAAARAARHEKAERETAARAQRRAEQEQARARVREARHGALLLKRRKRAIDAWVAEGMSAAEAEQLVDRSEAWETLENPGGRVAIALATLGLAATHSNPSRRPWRPIAAWKQAHPRYRGWWIVAATDGREWRALKSHRSEAAADAHLARLGLPTRAAHPRRRANPSIGGAVDPHALEQAERFHGTPRDTAALGPQERAPLPRDVVVIGQLESVSYKPLRGSKRAGAVWEHEVGDRGFMQPRATRKPLLVADPHTHRAAIVDGAMRFDPNRGLVG